MGCEIKRVPVNFNWPLNKVWFGYKLPPIKCAVCGGKGELKEEIIVGFKIKDGPEVGKWETHKTNTCEACWGDGSVTPEFEVPEGPGYQLWETVSEGSPISPSFETPVELAKWLSEQKSGWFSERNQSYGGWMKFILFGISAPSMVIDNGVIMDGVEAVVRGSI